MAMDDKQAQRFQAGQVFTPTTPIDELDLFAGRRDQVQKILDVVSQRGQHAILFGERGVGKTSLANVLAQFLKVPGPVVAPRASCTSDDTYESLWRKLFAEIRLQQEHARPGFTDDSHTTQHGLDARLPESFGPDEVRRQLSSIGGVFSIVIIDELDRLPAEVTILLADTIKLLSDYATRTTVVLVGVADSVTDLISAHESVERALVQIPMPRMSPVEVEEVLEKGSTKLGLTFSGDARVRVVMLSQGLPHYAHLLALYATYQAIEDGAEQILLSHVDAALAKALADAQQSIKEAYTVAVRSPRDENLFGIVLLACALAETDDLGFFAPAAVREPLSALRGKTVDIPSFARHLNEFTSEKRGQILEKTGSPRQFRYRFSNPLMQPYVIMRGIADGTLPPSLIVEPDASS